MTQTNQPAPALTTRSLPPTSRAIIDAASAGPESLARALLGATIASAAGASLVTARIVEVEVYLTEGDAAAHAARGLQQALAAQRKGPGTLYIHPMRAYCGMDVIARGGSVLIRAAEPLAGHEAMALRRGTADQKRLLRGPACLTQALGITRALQGMQLGAADCPISIATPGIPLPDAIATGPRIGLSQATDLPLRFWIAGSPHVSGAATRRAV